MAVAPPPPSPPTVPRVDRPSSAEIHAVRVQGLYARIPVGLTTTLVNAALMVPAMFGRPGPAIVVWAACVMLGSLMRLGVWAASRFGLLRLSPRAWGRLQVA